MAADRTKSVWYLDLAAASIPVGLQSAAAIAAPLIVGISTGHDRAESHAAAFARCRRFSILTPISSRLRMPRTTGIRPTAVYGFMAGM